MIVKKIESLATVILAEGDFFDAVNEILNYLIDRIIFIGSTLAVVALIVCGIRIFIASDPRSVEESKRMGIYILVGLCLLYGARILVATFAAIAAAHM